MQTSLLFSVEPDAFKFALNRDEKDRKEGMRILLGEKRFLVDKESPTSEEEALLLETTKLFDSRAERFKEIDPRFVDLDFSKGFTKWSKSIGLCINRSDPSSVSFRKLLVKNFNLWAASVEDKTDELARDFSSMEACSKNDMDAWLAVHNNLFNRKLVEHPEHPHYGVLKAEFENWRELVLKWKADPKEWLRYLVQSETGKGPSGVDYSTIGKLAMTLVYLDSAMSKFVLTTYKLKAVVEFAEGYGVNETPVQEMLKAINQWDSTISSESSSDISPSPAPRARKTHRKNSAGSLFSAPLFPAPPSDAAGPKVPREAGSSIPREAGSSIPREASPPASPPAASVGLGTALMSMAFVRRTRNLEDY